MHLMVCLTTWFFICIHVHVKNAAHFCSMLYNCFTATSVIEGKHDILEEVKTKWLKTFMVCLMCPSLSL